MITLEKVELPAQTEVEFRKWLRSNSADTLKEIVAALEQECQVRALNGAVTASNANLRLEAANADLEIAREYRMFLEIFNKLSQQTETQPFTTVKLT